MEEDEGPPPTRWEVELEFVQGLANPMYVHFLAQQKYLEDPDFLRYLEYLEYWRRPPHLKFIAYPNCLLMLTLLQQPEFRVEIAKAEVARLIMDEFYQKWQGTSDPQNETAVEANPNQAVEPPAAIDGANPDDKTVTDPGSTFSTASVMSTSASPAESQGSVSPKNISNPGTKTNVNTNPGTNTESDAMDLS